MTQQAYDLDAELRGVTKQQIDFEEQAHKNRRMAERTMSFRTAHAQFIEHFQNDEPDCVELVQQANEPPKGTTQCDEEAFTLARYYAWAKVVCEGESPVFYVLASGEAPYAFTYIWARFA